MRSRPVLFFAAAVLSGCADTVLTRIDVEGDARTTVEGSGLLGELLGELGFDGFTSMDITASEELQNQGVEPGDIKDARLVSFELEVIEPMDGDLSFLSELTVSVAAPDLPQVLLASQVSFPEGTSLVPFDVEEVDLTEYVTSQSLTLTTAVTGEPPAEDTTIEARYLIDVGVTLQGATRKRD
jgi:hypothetical protein